MTSWWSSGGTEAKKLPFDVLPQNCSDSRVQGILHQLGYLEVDGDSGRGQEAADPEKPKISRYSFCESPSERECIGNFECSF